MLLPFPPFAPDVADYQGATTKVATNVVPRADGYGPVKDQVVYSSALADGNDTFTKVLLHMNGADASTTFMDDNSGGTAKTWTAAGNAQIDTAQSKFGGASGLFDGTGDFATTPDAADLHLGSGDFTIDLWFNCNVAAGVTGRMTGQADAATTAASRTFGLVKSSAGDVISGHVFIGGSQFTAIGTTVFTNVTNTGWHHAALVRSGSLLMLFVDGVLEGSVAVTGSVQTSASNIAVGALGDTVALPWNGWLDEFRISVGIARWTAAFTPPGKAYDTASNGTCRGYFYARKSDGSIKIFAGTSTKLFLLNNTDLSWGDVSSGGAAYTTLTTSSHWQFAQFGNFVIAVQANVVPQVYDLSSSTAFATLTGSPPQAAYISIVGRFVVLTGLLSTPYRIQWSGLGDATQWTSGTNSSDFQDLPDGGICRGCAGGEFGFIFQETTIRRMTYVPGSPIIFSIDRIAQDVGLLAPYSLISNGNRVFFLSGAGFMEMQIGGTPQPIGKERIDRTFQADYDTGSIQMIIGSTEPESTRVYWGYKSQSGSTGLFDKILSYDFILARWGGVISSSGEYLASLSRPGLTLENLDSISGSIDALAFSLDDVSNAALAKLSAMNSAHKLCFYTGSNLEATIDTSEQTLDSQRRVRVKGLRPITDAAGCYGSVSSRETLQGTAVYSTEQVVNARGLCPANTSTRLARGHIRIPAGTTWTYASGMEPEFAQEGKR